MKIVRLEVENVKRVRSVAIEPDGALVRIGGRNGAGKSSTLDAIEMALAGASSIPEEPLRRGARRGRIVLDLGDLVVERTFTASGGSALTVRAADGTQQRSPQALLDSLCSRIAFDPLDFARAKPRDQVETLRRLTGLDFTALDRERASVYAQRTAANADAKEAAATARAMPHYPQATEERSAADVLQRLEAAQAAERSRETYQRLVQEAEDELAEARAAEARAVADVERLEAELEAARGVEATRRAAVQRARDALAGAEQSLAEAPVPDLETPKRELEELDRYNAQVRANRERDSATERARQLEQRAESLTEKIEAIDEQKRQALEAAPFPVPGLGFSEDCVTFGGLPLAQASSAEKLRVSVAMGLAMNPKLRVLLIRDGSLLDSASLRMVSEMATEAGGQVWVETVSETGEGCSVLIEDGAVAGAEGAVA